MCRLAIYLGPKILLSKFITEPKHSIIQQSSSAFEVQLQLNGDGFGISWYAPHSLSKYPALFTETTPAWSNANLRELARVTESNCILTHVRKASPNSPVVATNCHPFTYQKWAFMHNGYVGHFAMIKRRLVNMLSDDIYRNIQGSTDSEHLFALYLEYYRQVKKHARRETKVDMMADALCKVITTIEKLCEDTIKEDPGKYKPDDFLCLLNFVVTDGDHLVATRFTTGELKGAHTMYYCTGKHFHLHSTGHTEIKKDKHKVHVTAHNEFKEHEEMVIVSSEPLTDADDFIEIKPNYMIVANRNTVGIKSIEQLKLEQI